MDTMFQEPPYIKAIRYNHKLIDMDEFARTAHMYCDIKTRNVFTHGDRLEQSTKIRQTRTTD